MYPYQPYFNQQNQYQRTEVAKVNGEGYAPTKAAPRKPKYYEVCWLPNTLAAM